MHSYDPGVAQGDCLKEMVPEPGCTSLSIGVQGLLRCRKGLGCVRKERRWLWGQGSPFSLLPQPCSCHLQGESPNCLFVGEGFYFLFFKAFFFLKKKPLDTVFFHHWFRGWLHIDPNYLWEYSQGELGGEWSGWISWRKGLCLSSVTCLVGSAAVALWRGGRILLTHRIFMKEG